MTSGESRKEVGRASQVYLFGWWPQGKGGIRIAFPGPGGSLICLTRTGGGLETGSHPLFFGPIRCLAAVLGSGIGV